MYSDINKKLPDNLSLKCWCYKNNRRLMESPSFKDKSISERRRFVKENKLCLDCLSKTHVAEDCKSSFICCEKNCDKKHTILFCMQNNTRTYLQVLFLTVFHGDKGLSLNVLLYSASDSTLISKSLADYLNLTEQEREIQFTIAVSPTTKIKSKLINFSISSSSKPGKNRSVC